MPPYPAPLLNRGLIGVRIMRIFRYCCAVALVLAMLASVTLFQASAENNAANPFLIPGWQTMPYVCRYWWAGFSLTGGEELRVQWSTSSQIPHAVEIYVATPIATVGRWFCDVGPEAFYYYSSTFGSIQWVAPTTGPYAVLVVNDASYTVSGTISLTVGNATIPLSARGYGAAWQPSVCPTPQWC